MKSEFPYNITDCLEENDFWLCEHQVFDSYAIFQFKKNNEIIEVGLLTNNPEEDIKLIKKRENELEHQMIIDEISRKTRGVPLETYLYKYSHEVCLNAIGLLVPHMMVNLGFKYLGWVFVPVPDTEKYRIAVALEREKIFYTISVVEEGYFFSLSKPHFDLLEFVRKSNDLVEDKLEELDNSLPKRKSELSSIMNAQDAVLIATIEDLINISFTFSNNRAEEFEEYSHSEEGRIIIKNKNPIKLKMLPGNNFNSELEDVMDLISRLLFLEELMIVALGGMSGLPDSVLKLKNLKKLTIFEEDNLGSIPEDIGKLDSLIYLKLEGGQLERLPESIGNLSNLKKLIITDHYIEVLPDSMQNLSNLEYIDLRGNLLKSIPEWFLKLPSLRVLHMGRQQSGDKWLLKDKVAHKLKKKGIEVL